MRGILIEVLLLLKHCCPFWELIKYSLLHDCLWPCNNTCLILAVEDFVSCNPEELAQKCSLSYKVCGMTSF